MFVFRRAVVAALGAAFLLIGLFAIVPTGFAGADPQGNPGSDQGNPGNSGGSNGREGQSGGSNGREGQSGGSNGREGQSGGSNGREGQSGGSNGRPANDGDAGGSAGSNGSGARSGATGSNGSATGGDRGGSNDARGATGNGPQPCPPSSGNPGGSQPCGPPPCPPASPNAGGAQPCGHGPDPSSVAAAAARGAWTGDSAEVTVEVAVAGLAAARAEAQPHAGVARAHLSLGNDVSVLGGSVARGASEKTLLGTDDLELAREAGSSRSGARSLLALTGMSLLALLSGGLFLMGLGRLFRNVEGDIS